MEQLGQTQNCPICKTKILKINATNRDIFSYFCPVCGNVNITEQALGVLAQELKDLHYLLSGFTRERTELGLVPIDIRSNNIEEIVNGAKNFMPVSEKLDRILLFFERKSEYPGKPVVIHSPSDYPIAYAKNASELDYLLRQLMNLHWIQQEGTGAVLTTDGWNRVVEVTKHRQISDQVFVAMWFDPSMEKVFKEGIARAIRDSGFKPLRVDKLENNNKVCDLIIAEIRRSAFLVADFTGHRGGVYFEAGFALGLGIPVIWLCQKDQIDQAHFDTRQYNHIVWENETDLYEKLLNRINATIIH
jgi:nucleoside 2-deoxyribosyltransferase